VKKVLIQMDHADGMIHALVRQREEGDRPWNGILVNTDDGGLYCRVFTDDEAFKKAQDCQMAFLGIAEHGAIIRPNTSIKIFATPGKFEIVWTHGHFGPMRSTYPIFEEGSDEELSPDHHRRLMRANPRENGYTITLLADGTVHLCDGEVIAVAEDPLLR